MLKINEDGEWVMPRGLSAHDMACEIKDAVRDLESGDMPGWAEDHLDRDFTAVRRHVKVTHGNARKATLPKMR